MGQDERSVAEPISRTSATMPEEHGLLIDRVTERLPWTMVSDAVHTLMGPLGESVM